MSPIIKILPDNLINKIAAGEVVERPASVVKELIENAIDAGATEIVVAVERSGRRLIRVTDNGSGMSREDARAAFGRHATSKISAEADLEHIRTMGFRGEALSSIASVARVTLVTAQKGDEAGTLVEIEGGKVRKVADAAAPPGTAIEVNDLFYNTPARLKFLKSPATELSHLVDAVSRQAIARPDIRFKLTHGRTVVFDLPSAGGIRDRAFQLHGAELTDGLLEFSGGRDTVRVYGLASKPNRDRGDRSYQEFYINSRYVRNASLSHALASAYSDLIMRDRHPAGFVFIDIDPALVDVNVHPAKAEVRFRNQSQVHDLVRDVLREALGSHGRPSAQPPGREHADRVRDAVTEYLGSAERGARSTELVFDRPRSSSSHTPAPAPRLPVSASPGQLVPLAQVHDSFIIAQSNDGMALIDQHAAHERVLFEKLQDQYAAGQVPQQTLLLPVQVELGRGEQGLLKEYQPELMKLGFLVEEFGGGTFVVKAVPALMTGADAGKLLTDIVDELKVHGKSGRLDALRDEFLSIMACHPAVKVHRRLSTQEMEGLLSDLFACRMPHSCPHGRPTVVRFPMEEIKRMFKRI